MSIVLDSDTLVNLAKYINKGWPNLYQATVEDNITCLKPSMAMGLTNIVM